MTDRKGGQYRPHVQMRKLRPRGAPAPQLGIGGAGSEQHPQATALVHLLVTSPLCSPGRWPPVS